MTQYATKNQFLLAVCMSKASRNHSLLLCLLPTKTADLSDFWNVCRDFCVHFQLVYALQQQAILTDCWAGNREGCESAFSTMISNLYVSCFHSLLLITEAEI